MAHLLLVEDDGSVARPLQRILREEGYEVDVSDDGLRALARAESEPFDVIVLDVGLPGISGFDVCRQLRARTVQTPILILSAHNETEQKLEGFRLGADDYL